jgi:hypothetical protein
MKSRLILLLILFSIGLNGQAQTDSLEFEVIKKELNAGRYSLSDYQSATQKWFKHLNEFGKYPNLPVTSKGSVHYSFIIENQNLTKNNIFYHCQEWLALNLGIFPNQIYSNSEDGKIIFNSSFSTASDYECSYTGVCTVKDGKMLCEFFNLVYFSFIPGHYSGETWIADQTIRKPIEKFFPVFWQNSRDWEPTWQLFKTTNETIKGYVDSLADYLENYKQNNDF